MGLDHAINNMEYGEQFRRHRKWTHDTVEDKNILHTYWPLQQREAVTLLSELVESPQDFISHVQRFSAAVMMDLTYGYRVKSTDDPLIGLVERAFKSIVAETTPQAMLVDFFPFCGCHVLVHYSHIYRCGCGSAASPKLGPWCGI